MITRPMATGTMRRQKTLVKIRRPVAEANHVENPTRRRKTLVKHEKPEARENLVQKTHFDDRSTPQRGVGEKQLKNQAGQDRSDYNTGPGELLVATQSSLSCEQTQQQHARHASFGNSREITRYPQLHLCLVQHIVRTHLVQRSRTTTNLALQTQKGERTRKATSAISHPATTNKPTTAALWWLIKTGYTHSTTGYAKHQSLKRPQTHKQHKPNNPPM